MPKATINAPASVTPARLTSITLAGLLTIAGAAVATAQENAEAETAEPGTTQETETAEPAAAQETEPAEPEAARTETAEPEMAQAPELVGKTVTHEWTENPYGADKPVPSYVTFFCDDSTLVWNAVTDPSDIRSGTETYTRTDFAPGIVQITWKESPDTSNYGVIWTLKFETMESYGVIVNADPNANQILAGTLGVTDGLTPADGLTGCGE